MSTSIIHLEALLAHTLLDEGEVIDYEPIARHAPRRVAVVAVTSLVKESVLINAGWPVEALEGLPYAFIVEEGEESGGLD